MLKKWDFSISIILYLLKTFKLNLIISKFSNLSLKISYRPNWSYSVPSVFLYPFSTLFCWLRLQDLSVIGNDVISLARSVNTRKKSRLTALRLGNCWGDCSWFNFYFSFNGGKQFSFTFAFVSNHFKCSSKPDTRIKLL